MDHLDCPTPELWEERQRWVEGLAFSYENKAGSYDLSEQACALTAEVQSAFCAGAWVAVIIMALCVVEAQLKEWDVPGFKGNMKELLKLAGANPSLQKLRKRRNQLVHVNPEQPAITVDQQWANRNELETEARQAAYLLIIFEGIMAEMRSYNRTKIQIDCGLRKLIKRGEYDPNWQQRR